MSNNRRSVLIADSNQSVRFSSIPEIPTLQEFPTYDSDSGLSGPRSNIPSGKQLPSRSSHYRISPRNDYLSTPTSPLVEISDDRDNPFSTVSHPRMRTPEIRGSSQFPSPQVNYQRLSSVPPSPRFITPPDSPFGGSPRPRPKILFYHKHDPHYGFTNFSNHSVTYKGRKYSTSEHLFQSFKVGDRSVANWHG